ncbi:MAG: M13 family metallopeptidase [Candidatus Eisenbacteria bacterium]|nr:M13 family metallopeptidase [Candidatus Eisenbacteria bacterium]
MRFRALPSRLLLCAFACAFAWGLAPAAPAGSAPATASPEVPAAAPGSAARGLDPANLDPSVSPAADFNLYANGSWMKRTRLPASYGRYGGFTELADRNQAVLHRLLEEILADANAAPGSERWKLAAFHGACMDSQLADSLGAAPLRPRLERIAALKEKADLPRLAAELHVDGVGALFRFGAASDQRNSSMTLAQLGQGGLGLPDRDAYFKTDTAAVRIRTEYVAHLARTLQLLGDPGAEAGDAASRVMAVETAIAAISKNRVQLRDPRGNYHKMKVAELQALTPDFKWADYFEQAGLPKFDELNVAQPEFLTAVGRLMDSIPLADWKAYLRSHAVQDAAPLLSSAFVEENFRFERLLSGAPEMQPRWKRCLRLTDAALGDALGQEYVARHFTPAARARALEMVHNLEAALEARIRKLPWMSDSTRIQALGKLHAFGEKVGYAEKWKDYTSLKLERRELLLNSIRAQQFEYRRRTARIGGPVDRTEWGMTPATVNAYYSPTNNEIVFPAGILQPPFFDPEADDAVNYGGMGAVIGHEMTHGFDDRGRQFDAQGNLRDWWTPADAEQYKARAAKIIDQFSEFVAIDTLHVNGRLTTGENIADLGGLTVAYEALQRALAGQPRPAPIGGFTPEQRFFLSWAQIWRTLIRPEALRNQVLTDPHSPGNFRINGPLANMPEFHKAFGVKPGDAMYRPDTLRVEIW